MLYERPTVEPATFVDDDGADISYGRRWRMGSPPDDTYSVTRHPERFAPLLVVGRALRAYLLETYDVTEDGDRLVPRDPAAAPLTFTFGGSQYARVAAGVTAHEGAWFCSCDACDEDVEYLADNLERFVFAVTQGNFQEVLTRRDFNVTWSDGEGWRGSRTPRRALSRSDLDAMKVARRHKGARWEPWALRA